MSIVLPMSIFSFEYSCSRNAITAMPCVLRVILLARIAADVRLADLFFFVNLQNKIQLFSKRSRSIFFPFSFICTPGVFLCLIYESTFTVHLSHTLIRNSASHATSMPPLVIEPRTDILWLTCSSLKLFIPTEAVSHYQKENEQSRCSRKCLRFRVECKRYDDQKPAEQKDRSTCHIELPFRLPTASGQNCNYTSSSPYFHLLNLLQIRNAPQPTGSKAQHQISIYIKAAHLRDELNRLHAEAEHKTKKRYFPETLHFCASWTIKPNGRKPITLPARFKMRQGIPPFRGKSRTAKRHDCNGNPAFKSFPVFFCKTENKRAQEDTPEIKPQRDSAFAPSSALHVLPLLSETPAYHRRTPEYPAFFFAAREHDFRVTSRPARLRSSEHRLPANNQYGAHDISATSHDSNLFIYANSLSCTASYFVLLIIWHQRQSSYRSEFALTVVQIR